ncbi:hypothetical protein [Streptomyces antibioticus]|uniref:hypothetical protein n=1 Tax=Streptomyces antibioticus TaxID=1890 RepID=UPI0036D9C62D
MPAFEREWVVAPYAVHFSELAAKVVGAPCAKMSKTPCGTSWTPTAVEADPLGFGQWNADDPAGEDVRYASVGQLFLAYWVSRPPRRLSVLNVTWLG